MVDIRKFIFGLLPLLALAGCVAPRRAEAQFIGYVSPQTTQQTLATNLACTAAPQTFTINNIGQTQHYAYLANQVNVQTLTLEIDGVDVQGNITRISDQAQGPGRSGAANGILLTAGGYYPKVQVVVQCTPASTASYTLSYSGAWATFNPNVGSSLSSTIAKTVLNAGPENANASSTIQTPYGMSGGTIYAAESIAGAGGSLGVACSGQQIAASGNTIATFPLANTTSTQAFQVPDVPCPFLVWTYNNNGAGGTIVIEYWFNNPGAGGKQTYQYSHITGTTATAVKATPGFLHTLNINTAAAGTVSIFDLATAACTGTPATNTVAVITAPAATNGLPPFIYDTNLLNGICVKASVAMDLTVSYQ